MPPHFLLRRAIATLALAVAASFAPAAPLDMTPDAVLGQPDFSTLRAGGASATNLLSPMTTVEDPATGELWVSDAGAHRVLRYSSSRAFANGEAANLVLGQADFTSSSPNRGGAAGANTLNAPSGLAVDTLRRLHVADSANHRVLVFTPPYASGMGASLVFGQPDMAGAAPNRGGPITAAGLDSPAGLAIDAKGRLWVADRKNRRAIRLSAPIENASAPADVLLGQVSFSSNQLVPTSNNTLAAPAGIALDANGNVWIADPEANRVMRFPAPASGARAPPADLFLCQQSFTGFDFGMRDFQCNAPAGVAVDIAGVVYVADHGNSRLLVFAAPVTGASASTIAGQARPDDWLCNRGQTFAPSVDSLCGARHVMVDREGNVILVDGAFVMPGAGNFRVMRYDRPRPRKAPELANTSPSAIARLAGDFDLTLTGKSFYGDSVVSWNGRPVPTRYVSRDRLVARIRATDVPERGGVEVVVSTPGVAIASQVLRPVIHERRAGDATADVVLGQPDFDQRVSLNPAVGTQAFGAADPAALQAGARGVAIDAGTGRVFLAEPGGRVLTWPRLADLQNAQAPDAVIGRPNAFTLGCDILGNRLVPDARTLCNPSGLAVDGAGRLYVAEPFLNRVLRFDPPFATGMAAARVFGQRGSFTSIDDNLGGIGAESLFLPVAVATSGARLFILDAGNNRLLVYENPDTSTAATVAIGQPDLVSGASRGVGAGSFTIIGEAGLAVDTAGRVYVADAGANRVLRFPPPFANAMSADLVIGQSTFSARAGGVGANRLSFPAGLAVDAEGNLLVADSANSRVLRYAAPLSTGMAASAVLGQAGFATATSSSGATGLNQPSAIALDGAGNLVVADAINARLLAYDRPFVPESSKRLVNIATRMAVLRGDDVLIGGFVIGGAVPKRVVVRTRGPSLATAGIAGALANPQLQIFAGAEQIAANDNWRGGPDAAGIEASGFAPADDRESAVLLTLEPGAYTAIVSGAGGVTGVGIVEVFEVDTPASPLVNIATRGRVLTGADVMIGGFVIQGDSPQTVLVRARGPSLAAAGIVGPLANPVLQLFSQGALLVANDDWIASGSAAAILASGFAPADGRESAILVTLEPGAYTAVVSGADGATGVAIVEVFVL